MIQYLYKKHFVTIEHCWFCDDYEKSRNLKGSDIVFYHGVPEMQAQSFNFKTKQATLLTDLTEPLDAIYAKFNKNYRYEIRKCEKEGVTFQLYFASEMPNDILEEFEKTYNQMYKQKGMRTTFNKTQVDALIAANGIVFTVAFYENQPLVFHSYIIDEKNVRFFYSTSPFRTQKDMAALIARMNKGLHWYDIQVFVKKGVAQYDWGGVSINNENYFAGIDTFKYGFGGTYTEYWNCYKSVSILGKILLVLKKLIER